MKLIKHGYREAWPDPVPRLDLCIADDGTVIDGERSVRAMHLASVRFIEVNGVVYDINNIEESA